MYTQKFKNILLMLVLLVSISILLSACTNPIQKLPQKSAAVKVSTGDEKTEKVVKGDISVTIIGKGTYLASKANSLFYKDISGPLKKLSVMLGDEVKTGQVVAEIDNEDILKNISDSEQSLGLYAMRNQQLDENIKSAGYVLRLAEIAKETAEKRNSVDQSYLTQAALESATIQYEQALSSQKDAIVNKNLSDAQYALDLKKLNDLKAKADKTKLISPIDGIVVYVDKLSETELVPSGRVLVKVSEAKNIVCQMTTILAKNIHNVTDATLTVGGENYKVALYEPQAGDQVDSSNGENTVKNLIYLSFPDKFPPFKINENSDASLVLKKSQVLIVPKELIHSDSGKYYVDVLKDSKVTTVEVVTGLEQEENVEIISGLKEGDELAVR